MSLVSKQELMRRFRIQLYQFGKYLAAGMPYTEIASQRGLRTIMSIQTMVTVYLALLLLVPFYA